MRPLLVATVYSLGSLFVPLGISARDAARRTAPSGYGLWAVSKRRASVYLPSSIRDPADLLLRLPISFLSSLFRHVGLSPRYTYTSTNASHFAPFGSFIILLYYKHKRQQPIYERLTHVTRQHALTIVDHATTQPIKDNPPIAPPTTP